MNFLRRLFARPVAATAATATMPSRAPLISVIGATGTGKSQLAVELALALNGEVINADAMQLYRGLPIITNKVTSAERKGVPHYLLGFLDTREVWQVGRFVREAAKIIDDIRARGRLPILVGGSHYYVQSLLFPHDVEERKEGDEFQLPDVVEGLAEKFPILDAPTPELYAALRAVDPLMASRWHPNDRRKIRRSLEIYYSSGCRTTASSVYAAQRASKNPTSTSTSTEPARSSGYNNLIFWVHASTDVLRARLDGRVDNMLRAGMWAEIEAMGAQYDSLGGSRSVDLNTGIWQSIGFKEFLPYLELRQSKSKSGSESGVAPQQEDDDDAERARTNAIDEMKTATRQYARSQVRWIRIKFVNALKAAGGKGVMFLLDSSDAERYGEVVIMPAVGITRDFLADNPLPDPLSLSPLARENLAPKRNFDISQRPDLWMQRTCEICNVISTNEPEWETHMKSSKHKKRVASVQKKKEVDEFLRRRRREAKEAEEREKEIKEAEEKESKEAEEKESKTEEVMGKEIVEVDEKGPSKTEEATGKESVEVLEQDSQIPIQY